MRLSSQWCEDFSTLQCVKFTVRKRDTKICAYRPIRSVWFSCHAKFKRRLKEASLFSQNNFHVIEVKWTEILEDLIQTYLSGNALRPHPHESGWLKPHKNTCVRTNPDGSFQFGFTYPHECARTTRIYLVHAYGHAQIASGFENIRF